MMVAGTASVPVSLEFDGGNVFGGSFGLLHEPTDMMATGFTTGADVEFLNGNTGPAFEQFNANPGAVTFWKSMGWEVLEEVLEKDP